MTQFIVRWLCADLRAIRIGNFEWIKNHLIALFLFNLAVDSEYFRDMIDAILRIQFQTPGGLTAGDVVSCRQTIAKAITQTAEDERKEFAEVIRQAIEEEEASLSMDFWKDNAKGRDFLGIMIHFLKRGEWDVQHRLLEIYEWDKYAQNLEEMEVWATAFSGNFCF